MYPLCHITTFGLKLSLPFVFELFGAQCQVSNNAKFMNAIAIIYQSEMKILLQGAKKYFCRMQRNTVQLEKPLFLSHLFTHWELTSPEIQYAI